MLNLATLIRWTLGRAQAVNGKGREQRGKGAGAAPSIMLLLSHLRAVLV